MANQQVTINDVNFTVVSVPERPLRGTRISQNGDSDFLTRLHQYDAQMTEYLKDAQHLTAFLDAPQETFRKVCAADDSFFDELKEYTKERVVTDAAPAKPISSDALQGNRVNGWDIVSVLAAEDVNKIIQKALPKPIHVSTECDVPMGILGTISAKFSTDIENLSVIGGKGSAVYLKANIKNGIIEIDVMTGHYKFGLSATVQVNVSLECVSSHLEKTEVYLNLADQYVDTVDVDNVQLTVLEKPENAKGEITLVDDTLALIIKTALSAVKKIKLFSATKVDVPGMSKLQQVRYAMKEKLESVVLAALIQMTDKPGQSLDFDENCVPENSNMALVIKDDFFMSQILLPALKNNFPKANLAYQGKQIKLNGSFNYSFKDDGGNKTNVDITDFTVKFEAGSLKMRIVAEKEPSKGIHIKLTINGAYRFKAETPKGGAQNIQLEQVSFDVDKDASLEWWVYLVGGIASVLAFPIFGIIATALGVALTGTLSVIIKNCFIPDISGTQITGVVGCVQWEGANFVKIDKFDLTDDVVIGGTFTF